MKISISLFPKSIPPLKVLAGVFALVSAIFFICLSLHNIGLHSLKISYYYLLAKFYILIGIENFNMNVVGSFGAVFERKATDVANNFYVIEIYRKVIGSVANSFLISLVWTIFLMATLAFVFIASKWRKNLGWDIFSNGLIKNLFTKINISNKKPIQDLQKHNKSNSTKSENIHTNKKSKTNSKTYQLISDKNLPYPILKKVVLVGEEK